MDATTKQSGGDESKWVRVKVNNEYYELNESISDQSSSDEEDDATNQKVNLGGSAISIASSGLSREGAKGGRSRSSTISEANTPMKTPLNQPITAGEPSRVISRPVANITSKVVSQPVSTRVPVKTEIVNSSVSVNNQSAPARGIADLVPLRERMAGTSSAADRSAARHRSNSLSKETPEKWRMRIWPSKALTAFCRIITRCTPPESVVGVRLGAPLNGKNHKGGKVEKVGLKPHWRMSELTKVPMKFDDVAVHSSTFFLLTVEECREAVSHAEDPEAFAIADPDKKTNTNRGAGGAGNGWIKGEITAIVAESAGAPLPRACDPRLGSVWVVAAAISAPINGNANSSGKGGYGNKFGAVGCDISGGDLMVLHSPQWSHPLLGIIQPWDPDYDIKYGINFSVNQSTYISTQQPARDGSRPGQAPLQVVNILVCVDQSDGLGGAADIGGWATQGSIVPGVGFSMTAIGNVMTYIRECQALMSLKLINKSLQNMVLTGSFSPNYTAALRAATAAPAGTADSNTNSSGYASSTSSNQGRGRSTSMSSDSDGGIASSNRLKSDKADRVLSPRRALMEQPINCPENVPMPLWLALRRQYNESQLRAICMVSRRFQEKEYHTGQSTTEASLSLLQGPPGTGKTRTILGIVSVFLAGALNLTAQGTTRIVAGASLYGETAGEASTKWSDEKLQRPRGGSISHTNTVNADGQSSGKRTRVLICAPSNTAVDEVVYRLITQGVLDSQGKRMNDLSVIRIGQPCRDEYQRTGVDTFGRSRHQQQAISASDENMVRTVERATLDTLVEERRRTLMASDTRAQAGATLKVADIRKQILEGADVVCSTLSGAGSQPMLEVVLRITGFKFDAVIIDEAAQAVEPSSLIPFKYNPQAVVLVGDPCQLPATVFSATAKKAGYSQSLFQRLQVAGYPVLMLETQYRMHPAIAEYPSLRYYQSRLITGSQLITSDSHKMPYHADPSGKFRPFLFHNVPWSTETTEGTSTSNRDEARYVVDLFEELVTKYPEHRGGIGIIAPYRAQRRLLNTFFRERFGNQHQQRRGVPPIFDLDTEISTVDGFQGREKNIVIFSCVRAPTNRNHYFNTRHLDTSINTSAASAEGGAEEVEVAGRGDDLLSETQSNASSSSSATSSAISGPAFRGIGFLKEWQRLNVAITRSRYALWIVGNSDVLSADSEWRHLVDYSKKKNSFYTAPFPDVNTSNGNNNNCPGGSSYHGNNFNKHHQQNNNQQRNNNQGKNFNKNQNKHKNNKPPPPPPRPPLSVQGGGNNNNHHNASSAARPVGAVRVDASETIVANTAASDGIVASSMDINRPAKRPPQPPQVPSSDPVKKPRPDRPDGPAFPRPYTSTDSSSTSIGASAQTSGPFSYNEVASSYQQGPFSFAIQPPSRDFDINERNPAAMHTYLPPAQAGQHPLSPQQRQQVRDQQKRQQFGQEERD